MAESARGPVMEPEPIVLYNDPLLLCTEQNNSNQCSYVFKNITNDIIPNSTIILEPTIYQIRREAPGHFATCSNFNGRAEVPYHLENANKVQMLQIYYKNVANDQPEFVDVNHLTSLEYVENKTVVASEDESDVIFVKEYKKEVLVEKNDSKDEGVRRNPVRKARTNKGKRHLQKEHLLEEDFDFLDEFDEDNLVFCKNKASSPPNSSCMKDYYKEWPINVFERPEFNPQTNKIEPFDYTIRDILNTQVKKKPRLETCIKSKRKPKKKYIIRKRRALSKKAVHKTPIKELSGVFNKTFDMLTSFIKSSEENNLRENGLYDLLKNQTALMAMVNNFNERELVDCVSKLLSKS